MKKVLFLIFYLLFIGEVMADRYLTLDGCRKTNTSEIREIFLSENGLNLKLNLDKALILP